MTRPERIAAEIIAGGPELAEQVIESLHAALGWRTDDPPLQTGDIVVCREQTFRYVPYASDKARKKFDADGRWQVIDDSGKLVTAKLPKSRLWRAA